MKRTMWEVVRLLVSVAGAAALLVVGSMALFVTAAPKWVSLLVEPLSLLLIPGVGFSMIFTQSHDYVQKETLQGAFGFYMVLVYGLMRWRDGHRGLAQR